MAGRPGVSGACWLLACLLRSRAIDRGLLSPAGGGRPRALMETVYGARLGWIDPRYEPVEARDVDKCLEIRNFPSAEGAGQGRWAKNCPAGVLGKVFPGGNYPDFGSTGACTAEVCA